MKTIFAVKGIEGVGKTAVIRKVYEKLSGKPCPAEGDICDIIEYQPKKIGIESQGDPDSRQGASLKKFAEAGCDIIVCASRTKMETWQNIKNIDSEYDYHIVQTYPFYSHKANKNKGMHFDIDLNDEFASAIVKLIDKLLKEQQS